MNHTFLRRKTLQPLLTVTVAVFLTLVGIRLLSVYDNKYTKKAQTVQGITSIIPENGICFLVDNWELYPDQLLVPEDFTAGTPSPRYITWLGEYPNLSAFHTDGNPYGCATYRLLLQGNGTVTLYLPEPLCATRVFVNGINLGGAGETVPERYSPLIRDTAYSFAIDKSTELIIQVSNYSHYYGGLWYPPAIGAPDSISHLTAYRILFYALLFFTSLTLSLFCMVFKKDEPSSPVLFYFGMLSLAFALRICYPFLRLAGIPLIRSLYALEDCMALTGLMFALKIAFSLFLPEKYRKLPAFVRMLTLGMCAVSVILPVFILPAFPALVQWYGILISWYKVFAAILLIGSAFCGCLTGRPHILIPLAAAVVNGVCLLYGVLAIGHFEPAIGGWPEEYGAFGMVIAFAILMVQRNRDIMAENVRLNLHLQEEVEEKTFHLHQLLSERGQLITELGHDMKSPLTSLSNMAQIIRSNDIMLDPNTIEKMSYIEEQCALLSHRLQSIQTLASEAGTPPHMEALDLNRFLADFHYSICPVIEMNGPDFYYEASGQPCRIMADPEKLSRALENLLYNAADFTPADGKITLTLKQENGFACIHVSDTGCGIPEKELSHIFQRLYTTRRKEGGQGLGLSITKTIITEHQGEISVMSEEGKGTTFVIRIPSIETDETV